MRFFTEWERLKVEKRLLMAVILILAASIIVLVFALRNAMFAQRVIVIPPIVRDEFSVSGNNYSKAYLEQIAYYLCDRLLSVSPESVKSSFDAVLQFAGSDNLNLLKSSLDKQAETIIKERIYQTFYPANFGATPNSLTVEGSLRRFAGNIYQSETQTSVIFQYRINNGRLYITSFEAKPFEAK
jgi:conjugal transfer pilus assembly protein TraE